MGTNSVDARVTSLETQVRDLRLRVAQLERLLSTRAEHPVDQSAVRKKVTYDWQA